jgi:hypothetical protein
MKCVLKHLGLAAISLACSIGFAQAQQQRTPPDGAALAALIPPPPPAPPGVTVGGSGFIRNPNGPSPPLVNGTNLRHGYQTLWYTNQTYHYIFCFNIEGDYLYFYINSALLTSAQVTIKEFCLDGRLYYAYQQATGPYFVNEIWQNNGN